MRETRFRPPARQVLWGIPLGLFAVWVMQAPAVHATELTFDDRVRAQAAIEDVYRGHRLGKTARAADPLPHHLLEAKVRKYLAQSRALEDFWQRPITSEMLEREVARMAAETRMPARLAELFAAIGNDPILIQECLARARLADRLVTEYAAADERLLRESRDDEPPLKRLLREYSSSARELAIATVASPEFVPPTPGEAAAGAEGSCPAEEWDPLVAKRPEERTGATSVWTGSQMIVWGGLPNYREYGDRYDPATNSWTHRIRT